MEMETVAAIGVGAALLVGLAGTVGARVPGVPLSWTATIVWASIDGTLVAWIVVAAATVLALANYLIQHRLAGGDWAELAVADRSWIIGAGAAIAGVLLARLPGLIFGFVGGTYIAERRRLNAAGTARNAANRSEATRTAVLSPATLAEFVTAAAIGAAWLVAFAG